MSENEKKELQDYQSNAILHAAEIESYVSDEENPPVLGTEIQKQTASVLTEMKFITTAEEQGGSQHKSAKLGAGPIEDESGFDLFNNLDQNINEYQIDRDEHDGTIRVKIGTTYSRQTTFMQPHSKVSLLGEPSDLEKSPQPIEEEKNALDEVKQVFGQKFNFEVTLDPSSKCGLRGLPPNIE